MDPITVVLGGLAAVGVGASVWLLLERGRGQGKLAAAETRAEKADGDLVSAKEELAKREARVAELTDQREGLRVRITELEREGEESERRHTADLRHAQEILAEQLKAVEGRERQVREDLAKLHEQTGERFRSLSAETLSRSTQEFLKLAEQKFVQQSQMGTAELEKRRVAFEQLIKPVTETLAKTEGKLSEIEKARIDSASAIVEQIRGMSEASAALRDETGKLARALREPHVRGRYGELQLRRVAELAGMSAYCDFCEQSSTVDGDGNALRPDMLVRLPSGRVVVVDAKTNIQGYLDALHAPTPAESEGHLERFAKHVADQAGALSRKQYWKHYEGSPEFVVMFIPGDQFIDAALARQPEILESAARQGVILASPSTLIGLLRAVHVGYKEQKLAAAAVELKRLGVEFHERAAVAFGHIAGIGDLLERTVNKYNEFVGSYRSRLEPTLRRFEEEGAKSAKDLPEAVEVTVRVREGQGLFGPADREGHGAAGI